MAKRAGEAHFRQMIDALPTAIYITDADGRLTHFNPAAVEFSGRIPELGSDRWCVTLKLYHTDGTPMPHDRCPMAIALQEGRRIQGDEAIAERPDGTRIWFAAYPSPLRDGDGRIVGGINMLVDITEAKRAEALIRQRERELADFFENATMPMHWVGSDGTILRANQAELELLGYSRDEYVGRPITDFHVDREVIDGILGRLKAAEELRDCEARLRCKDGSIRDVLISSNVLWRDGRFIHTRCFTRDVTERKRSERLLVEQKAREARARRQAEAARAEAEKANRAKAKFLATMSHELRTPLNAIIGYSDLLDAAIDGTLTDKQQSHVARIEASARHLLQLIEEILSFSRIEAGRERVHVEPVEPAELVRSTADLVAPLARRKDLQFDVWTSDGIGVLQTDPGKVRQILLNLLSNAIKFTEKGSVRLEASMDGGKEALFSVRDTGSGIPAEKRESIFEAFSQGDWVGPGGEGGTGLGLSVSRHLAHLLGGTVELESVVGEGSTFTLRLPLAESSEQ